MIAVWQFVIEFLVDGFEYKLGAKSNWCAISGLSNSTPSKIERLNWLKIIELKNQRTDTCIVSDSSFRHTQRRACTQVIMDDVTFCHIGECGCVYEQLLILDVDRHQCFKIYFVVFRYLACTIFRDNQTEWTKQIAALGESCFTYFILIVGHACSHNECTLVITQRQVIK